MIIYEVNCIIKNVVKNEFLDWLPAHINSLLSIEGFLSAETFQLLDDDKLSEFNDSYGISIRYCLENKKTLDDYLQYHAANLREEGKKRFSDNLFAYRRVLQEIKK